jgi:origin recognition complex subunit 2
MYDDDYFSFQNTKSAKSSHPSPQKIPLNDILTIVRGCHNPNTQNKTHVEFQSDDFPLYLNELGKGLNIILHGYGSKRSILEEFGQYCVKEGSGTVCTCDGYMLSSFPPFLRSILEKSFSYSKVGKSITETCSMFEKLYNQKGGCKENLYMLIHNIDAKQFQSQTMQSVIERLSDIPQIHIIASVDHMNAALLHAINPSSSNFIWHELNTYEKYVKEVKFMSTMAEKITSVDSDRQESIANVLKALPLKTRQLFKIMATHLTTNLDTPGLLENEILETAQKEMICTSLKQLEGFMVELIDHKIIQKKSDSKKRVLYGSALDRSTLRFICERLNEA